MRIGAEFEHMGHKHEISAVCFDRQKVRSGKNVSSFFRGRTKLERDAACVQEIVLRKPDLHGVVTEHVCHRPIEIVLLPFQQILTQAGFKPLDYTFGLHIYVNWRSIIRNTYDSTRLRKIAQLMNQQKYTPDLYSPFGYVPAASRSKIPE